MRKHNIPLIVGLSIPVLMILFVAGSIYLPGVFVHPKTNFLYSYSSGYNYNYQIYAISNGKLIINSNKYPDNILPKTDIKLYIYDVVKNESKEISFYDAQQLSLDSSIKSKDGFEITYGKRGNGIFPFFYFSDIDYNSRYITGHNVSKKLNLQLNGNYYYSFQFLGWIN